MSEGYDVGYGKPPKKTRWEKGISGNKKGRPRTKSDTIRMYADILSEPVTAKTPDGKSTSLGGLEAGYFSLCKKALSGDKAALLQAVKVMLDLLPAGNAAQEEEDAELKNAKRELYRLVGLPMEDYRED